MFQEVKIVCYFSFIFFLLTSTNLFSQDCPKNIGFELGDFEGWQCDTGIVAADGTIKVNQSKPLSGIHSIYKNSMPQQKDPFGDFPVNCPNGSGYSIQLGNSQTGAKAEAVSYTFTVPQNVQDYSIIYNYAVVLQNPNHAEHQQPKFQSRVFDVTGGKYIDCGSFQFVASPNLPGFVLSPRARDVYYKSWSPITINLFGYAGKTIRIEFTTNDCTLGGHFGYAYLDVNENCASPISGNTYCAGANGITLTAPFGFKEYRWYTEDFSTMLGTSNILKISPPPPANTNYALEIIPFPGLGCLDTLETSINALAEVFTLKVADSVLGCSSGVDLTSNFITAGSTPGIKYSYFLEENQLNYLATPSVVQKTGSYYIKGVGPTGCNDIKPIQVFIKDPPKIIITDPSPVCFPATVDITNAKVTQNSDPGLNYSFWTSSDTTTKVTNPTNVTKSGTYYIKGAATFGCADIQPVKVLINPLPVLKTNNITGCENVDLLNAVNKNISTFNLTYSYWEDSTTRTALTNSVKTTGSYYIKGVDAAGCSTVASTNATVNPNPVFTLTKPAPVTYPTTIDLTKSVVAVNLSFSYWYNAAATSVVRQPRAVTTGGTYYVKGVNEYGCSTLNPLEVVINAPPLPSITSPNAFSPNGDGVNDLFQMSVDGVVKVKDFKIFNRSGQLLYQSAYIDKPWDGKWKGQVLPIGIYYWVIEFSDIFRSQSSIKSGSVTLLR